jgi:Zn-dependent protease/CBS domain-containing protein
VRGASSIAGVTDGNAEPPGEATPRAGGGMQMGRILGVPIYVTPAWFLVAALITLFFADTVERAVPGMGAVRYVVSASFALLLYGSVLLHELSHTVVALRLGLPVRRVTLHLLGGVSEIEREPETPGREFLVAIAGPVVSLALGGAGALLVLAVAPGTVGYLLAWSLAVTNLLVGGFNMLPGLPLDGGRVLRAGVWRATGRPYTGTLAAAWVGRVLAVCVLAAPLLPLLADEDLDVVNVVWAALVASFVWVGASQAIFAARVRERLPGLQARTLTRRAVPARSDVPLAEALRRAADAGATGIVVLDGDGSPGALVNEAAVTAIPEHRRPWVTVSTVSRRVEPGLVLGVGMSGEDLLAAMRRHPATEYLVLDEDGAVYGVLAAADVDQVFASL